MRSGISYLDVSEDGVVCSLGSPAVLLEDEKAQHHQVPIQHQHLSRTHHVKFAFQIIQFPTIYPYSQRQAKNMYHNNKQET